MITIPSVLAGFISGPGSLGIEIASFIFTEPLTSSPGEYGPG